MFETEIATIRPELVRSDNPEMLVYDGTEWFLDIWRQRLSDRVPRSEFLLKVRGFLDRLIPVCSIRERVDAFASAHELENALGLHIRHTGNVIEYETQAGISPSFDIRRISSLQGFLREIESHLVSGKVYLATDNRRIEKFCVQRYGKPLLTYPKQYKDGGLRTSTMEDALIEMTLLGRCREIVGTYYSSYSQFAAIWSNTAYSEVIGNVRERNVFVDKMLAAMRNAN